MLGSKAVQNRSFVCAAVFALTVLLPATGSAGKLCDLTAARQAVSMDQTVDTHERFESLHLIGTFHDTGPHHGTIDLLERKPRKPTRKNPSPYEDWDDTSPGEDIPGNILTAARHLPEALKAFFTAQTYDQSRRPVPANSPLVHFVSLPNGVEIQAGRDWLVRDLKMHGQSAELVGFYVSDGAISALEHLRMFAAHGLLPMAKNGRIREHDFTYHFLSSLVMPDALTLALRERARLIVEFYDFVAAEAARHPDSLEMQNLYLETLNRFVGMGSEALEHSGNIIGDYLTPEAYAEQESSIYVTLLGTRTPLDYLMNLRALSGMIDVPGFKPMFDHFTATLSPNARQADVPTEWLRDPQAFHEAMTQRLQQLNEAARRWKP